MDEPQLRALLATAWPDDPVMIGATVAELFNFGAGGVTIR
jgi:hypothetical protein